MNRVKYKQLENLKSEYLKIFHLDGLQSKWAEARDQILTESCNPKLYPENFSEILVGDFSVLAAIYFDYQNFELNIKNGFLKKQFKYSGHIRSRISEFFNKYEHLIGIHTCCYCDMAYVNTYKTEKRSRSHFDLDHVLPKNKCPILSLSLFNLVPCCPICNQRLKRDDIWATCVDDMTLLSPTSTQYAFDEDVQLRIVPLEAYPSIDFIDHPDKFKVEFHTDSPIYRTMIDKLCLNERYDYHKCEALKLMDKLQRYPSSYIKMISNTLNMNGINYSPSMIKEDLFGQDYISSKQRTFSKLNRDIYKTYHNNDE